MLVALNWPGCICIITRPSPELFGLIDATSNAHPPGGGSCGAWAASAAPPASSATIADDLNGFTYFTNGLVMMCSL
jgi:hypothetical protein